MLIQVTRAEGVPGVQFCGHAEVDEPVILQRLPEIPRGVRRDVRTDLGDAFQFLLPLRVRLLLRQLLGFFRVAFCKADQSVGADVHCLELFLLIIGFWIVQVIQVFQALLDVSLEIEESFAVDFVIQDGVTRRPLLHELGKDAGLIRGLPLLRHFLKDEFAHGLPPPEGDDGFLVDLPGLGADGKGYLFPGIEDVQIFQGMAAQFRVGRRGFGGRAFFTDDQFAFVDADGLVFHQILKGQGAAHRRGQRSHVLFVEFGHQFCSLGRDGGHGVQALLPQPGHSFTHRHGINLLFSHVSQVLVGLVLSRPSFHLRGDRFQANHRPCSNACTFQRLRGDRARCPPGSDGAKQPQTPLFDECSHRRHLSLE